MTTKPKRPRHPKPVLAWCALNADGNIRPGWCVMHKSIAARWAKAWGRECIRVEIRPVRKAVTK